MGRINTERNLREGRAIEEAVLWGLFSVSHSSRETMCTKLGKEVNSNKRGSECSSLPCQVLENKDLPYIERLATETIGG